MKINDIVDIPKYKGTINESAMVVKFDDNHVWLSNSNMPFIGTLMAAKFARKDIKERKEPDKTKVCIIYSGANLWGVEISRGKNAIVLKEGMTMRDANEYVNQLEKILGIYKS